MDMDTNTGVEVDEHGFACDDNCDACNSCVCDFNFNSEQDQDQELNNDINAQRQIYVSRVYSTLDKVISTRPVVGEFLLDRPWDTVAVVTEPEHNVVGTGRDMSIHLLYITVPGGAVISVTYDRKRQFGRKYRIRTTAAIINRICDVAGSIEAEKDAILVKTQSLIVGHEYEFDLARNTLFVMPGLKEAHKLITYIKRYKE